VISRKILAASLAAIALLGVVRHTRKTTPDNAPVSVPAGYVIPDAVTHHSLLLSGKRIAYTARAGTIVLRDDDNHPTATMFYTAYTRDGVDSVKRPVTFFYNGGPGSSTIWLRMGSFGPVRAVTGDNGTITRPPPYHLVDNSYSLLDASDLVFVDMPASGYGRILPGADAKNIFGTDNDIRAFADFVESYITRFNRWNSPKVLYGESYGTPRTAMLVDTLETDGVGMNGVVLQSSILNYALASRETFGATGTDDWQYVFAFPTEAATAWYYHAVPGAPSSLDAYMREVTAFAMGDYRRALGDGDSIPQATFDGIVARMHHYTGISEQYIRNAKLRVSGEHFLMEFRRSQGKIEGAYDSRYQLFSLDREGEYPDNEATGASMDSPFISLGNQYLRETLNYRTNLPYRTSAYAAIAKSGPWDFKHNGSPVLNTTPDLADAMTINPYLRVYSANGYYDSVTPFLATVYALDHLNLAPSLQRHISYGFYPAGHMMYLNVVALARLHLDLERWYAGLQQR
jgi:carboxypeptidase C (cathepsin A)